MDRRTTSDPPRACKATRADTTLETRSSAPGREDRRAAPPRRTGGIEFVSRFRSGAGRRYRSEAAGLDELVERLRPAVCFFGHHHHRIDAEVAGVRCIGLDAVGRPRHLVAFSIEAGSNPTFLGEWPRSDGATTRTAPSPARSSGTC
jgi:hypothetical protein